MKVVVFGATELTHAIIQCLYENDLEIAAVVTISKQFKISYKADAVNNNRFVDLNPLTKKLNVPLIQYLDAEQTITDLKNITEKFDLAIVAGWYHLLPKKLRDLFLKGCGGFHASLLPILRGGAPLNWAIILGLKETGVSFFKLEDGVDNGFLYDQEKFIIDVNDKIKDLIRKCEDATLKILKRTLPKLLKDELVLYPQAGIPSYGGQRNPEDSLINWSNLEDSIIRLIRASSEPYGGAYSYIEGKKIIIWEATENSEASIYGVPGQVIIVENNVYIACGDYKSILVKDADNMDLLKKSNFKRMQSIR